MKCGNSLKAGVAQDSLSIEHVQIGEAPLLVAFAGAGYSLLSTWQKASIESFDLGARNFEL